jgi:hypothetical protein
VVTLVVVTLAMRHRDDEPFSPSLFRLALTPICDLRDDHPASGHCVPEDPSCDRVAVCDRA